MNIPTRFKVGLKLAPGEWNGNIQQNDKEQVISLVEAKMIYRLEYTRLHAAAYNQ